MDTKISSTAHIDTLPSQFVEVNGFRVHYKREGSGPRLVLLLHGSFLSLRSWRHTMAPLAERVTVVAIDRPVFGQTSKPLPKGRGASLYSAEAQSDLVASLVERLGFEEAVLVGSSTGGTIALLTALRHPKRVSGLVLVGAMVYSGYATSEVPRPVLGLMKGLRPIFSRLMKAMIKGLWEKAQLKFWHDHGRIPEGLIETYRQDFMVGPWERAFFELFLATRRLDLGPKLARLETPTLVVTGDHDRAVKPAESERLAQEIPDARLIVIDDCGHLPQEEQPASFNQALQDFLEQARLLRPGH